MSYLVLARKYRPTDFDNVIGQSHITDILKSAIESDRLAHAYLFCGPRGIGKTSCARILAKALNCQEGPTVKPCNTCAVCADITKGNSFDVLEIDGASNRGIDEIRALRENVKFAPNYSRYKVYIVDEVHMLTTEAFNALLKTLEEPPPHVKFIFATTEPNKLPATIISRCQRFDFKRISVQTTLTLLTEISKKEKVNIAQEALFAIARASKGSLRDALSILDQISALNDRTIGAEDVFSMLGIVETDLLFRLVDALGQKDCIEALKILESITEKGKDIRQMGRDLIEHFRHLMVIKIGGKSLGKLIDYPISIKELLLKQCDLFTLKEILKSIDTFIQAQETARITESNRMSLEVAFAKLTYTGKERAVNNIKSPGAKQAPEQKSSYSPMDVLKNKKGEVRTFPDDDSSKPHKGPEEDMPAATQQARAGGPDTPGPDAAESNEEESIEKLAAVMEQDRMPLDIDRLRRSWDGITYAVSRKRMSVATYLQDGFPVELKKDTLVIGFNETQRFQKEALEDDKSLKLVEDVLKEKTGRVIVIKYQIIDQKIEKQEDEDVRDVLDAFEGQVTDRWHNE